MKGIIIGKEIKKYVDKTTGEVKTKRTLWVLWDAPKNLPDGFEGQKCESVYVTFELPEGVAIHSRCNFEYEVQQTRGGSYARLVDVEHIEKMVVSIKPITDAHNN